MGIQNVRDSSQLLSCMDLRVERVLSRAISLLLYRSNLEQVLATTPLLRNRSTHVGFLEVRCDVQYDSVPLLSPLIWRFHIQTLEPY